MEHHITREAAWELLRKYNKDPFHLLDAMRDCEAHVSDEMQGI